MTGYRRRGCELLSAGLIAEAAEFLRGRIRGTPVEFSPVLSDRLTVLRASALEQRNEEQRTQSLRCVLGEIPRGALTEIAGPVSSGRTAFLYSLLAGASANQEFCALIDAENTFDPWSAAAAGVHLSQVLWVRCGGNVEHALKAADMLAQAGGFGLVAVDLGDTPLNATRRIPLAAWFRLRHGVENTKTALVSIGQQVNAHSCSALKIELRRDRVLWRRGLLNGLAITARFVKNHREQRTSFTISRSGTSRSS